MLVASRLLACVGVLASLAAAQAVLGPADKVFMNQAGIGGTEELQLSALVDQRSSNPEVRRFAARMLDDHSQAAAELKSLLSHRNVTAPDDVMDPIHTDVKFRLMQLGNDDFDRLYISTMVTDHENAVRAFQTETSQGSDPTIKAFAEHKLP